MYAIIRQGGKQYRVSPGDLVRVELIPADPGARHALSEVLFVAHDAKDGQAARYEIGRPTVAGFAAEAEVVRHVKGPKHVVFWKSGRLPAMKKRGHRQTYTELRVLRLGDYSAPTPEAAPAAPAAAA